MVCSADDPFADAKANIRDTVKWLVAIFATLAAAVIGGSSISGLGAISILRWEFGVGVACLLAAFACICAALRITLRILRPEAMFRSDLYGKLPNGTGVNWTEVNWTEVNCTEVQRIRSLIDNHASDLLPYNYTTLQSLGQQLDDCAKTLGMERPERDDFNEALRIVGEINPVFERLLILAQYLRLQMRLQDALPALLWLGIGALVALTAFGVIIQQSTKTPTDASEIIIVQESPDRSSYTPPAATSRNAQSNTSTGCPPEIRCCCLMMTAGTALMPLRWNV